MRENEERPRKRDTAVEHPPHYNAHPSGVECIDIVEHFTFNLGNAVKYVWRHGLKPGASALQDLKKARFYLDREIERLDKQDTEERAERRRP